MRRDPATVAGALLLAALAAVPLAAPAAARAWDLGNLAGLAALLACLLLVLWPVRPRSPPAPRTLALRRHRDLGLAALGLGLGHALVLWWSEPQLWLHLLPSAPVYMLAGTLALLLLAYLALGGVWPLRRRLAPATFQIRHLVAALLFVVLAVGHALGARRYLAVPAALPLALGAGALSFAVLLRRRRHGRHAPAPGAGFLARLAADGACPRHGGLLIGACALSLAALLALGLPPVPALLAATPVARTAVVPLAFPHEKHRDVNCVRCHHNYVDHTGSATCIACHRARPLASPAAIPVSVPVSTTVSTPGAIRVAIEPRFHDFCEGCHAERARQRADAPHGPLRSCAGCHRGTLPFAGGLR